MRLFPAVNLTALFIVMLLPSIAFAQNVRSSERPPTPNNSAAKAQATSTVNNAMAAGGLNNNNYNTLMTQGAQAAAASGLAMPPGAYGLMQQQRTQRTQEELAELLKDPDSAQSKARLLALQAEKEGTILNFAQSNSREERETVTDTPIPPEMDTLQYINENRSNDPAISDEEVSEELMSLDLRRDAQKEAALSYGARGGLAKRSYQIAERLKGFEGVLDQVFNFRALLVTAPSGLLIEPPIVREALDAILITSNGNEAAVADRVLNINKQAKIVSAPRDWRHYLVTSYSVEVPPPPRILWPQNAKEQAAWNGWVRQGWQAGYEQGVESFETNVNRLVADYNGMVRYRMLLAEGMISQPYAMHEDRGVTGGKNEMRVGDRALRITGPSQFLTGSDLWKPADR